MCNDNSQMSLPQVERHSTRHTKIDTTPRTKKKKIIINEKKNLKKKLDRGR